ncbi:hypothetical protein J7K86_03185 [bacterium]|nr:hypothetical protein [bacterium]
MIKFYIPGKFNKIWPRFSLLFLRSYFKKRPLSPAEKFKIKYFEIRNLVQMTTNLIFLQKEGVYKKKMLNDFSQQVGEKIKEIEKLEKCLMTNI